MTEQQLLNSGWNLITADSLGPWHYYVNNGDTPNLIGIISCPPLTPIPLSNTMILERKSVYVYGSTDPVMCEQPYGYEDTLYHYAPMLIIGEGYVLFMPGMKWVETQSEGCGGEEWELAPVKKYIGRTLDDVLRYGLTPGECQQYFPEIDCSPEEMAHERTLYKATLPEINEGDDPNPRLCKVSIECDESDESDDGKIVFQFPRSTYIFRASLHQNCCEAFRWGYGPDVSYFNRDNYDMQPLTLLCDSLEFFLREESVTVCDVDNTAYAVLKGKQIGDDGVGDDEKTYYFYFHNVHNGYYSHSVQLQLYQGPDAMNVAYARI